MVKLSNLFLLFGLTTLSAFVTGYSDSEHEYTGDCLELSNAIDSKEIQVEDCSLNRNNKIFYLTIGGDSINQKVIDTIESYDSELTFLNFEDIKNYPKNLNLEAINATYLAFYDISLDISPKQLKKYNDFRAYSLPKGVLKSAKNVDEINLKYYQINQRTIDELSTLKNLRSLTLFDCSFDSGLDLSKFKNLKKLYELFISDFEVGNSEKVHPFDGFNESFCQFKNLKLLDVRHSNISKIPDCISNLKYLEELDLSKNKIKKIPSAVSKLKNLKGLVLNDNKIKEIPNHISKLQELFFINLSNNSITTLPEFLGQLPKLKHIILEGNNVSVPDSLKNNPNIDIKM